MTLRTQLVPKYPQPPQDIPHPRSADSFRLHPMMTNHYSLLFAILVIAIKTLNTEEELKETGFGFPPPRHGLALIKWYVKTCIDNNMVALCNPVAGQFGFHEFHNSGFLLPPLKDKHTYMYFTIGNLHYRHAKDLPYEVRKYYDPHNKMSNMDRVIVKLNRNKNKIEEIYISEHYNPPRTFQLGASLIGDLRQDQNSQNILHKIFYY
ncbi:hypothetical protein G5714_015829 [Onychostoma macrolepis]|uniref:Uncharacterized protein n=2 Tax=Onychostoma macrolepis TaxID=369639 RepID=A0A7J6C6W5_9TELE|nr:hypothetical protein G5714_015829 [Onychostoma macrolepis]